jgi:thymidylate synthase
MRYYVKDYNSESKSEVVAAGYGPRFLDWRGVNQLKRVAEMLSTKQHSRQAVVQLFDADDLKDPDGDIPCTCTLQFMLRNEKLLLITNMRSNDVFLGLPHDFFAFTMIQELLARQLGVDLGPYVHFVGSLHLYERNQTEIDQFIGEGWQSTLLPMPDMPLGDPWSSVDALLRAERELREVGALHTELSGLEPYWMDLVRLLRVYRHFKNRDCSAAEKIRAEMSTQIYDTYINKKVAECLSISRRTSTPVG